MPKRPPPPKPDYNKAVVDYEKEVLNPPISASGARKEWEIELKLRGGASFNVHKVLESHPHYSQLQELIKKAVPMPTSSILHRISLANKVKMADLSEPLVFKSSDKTDDFKQWCSESRNGRKGLIQTQ